MLNRAGGSKAGPTTQCQKCLKRGHYSYECTGARQDRPYISRPSRTQQLQNPKKFATKLTNAKPAEPPAPSIPKLNKDEWQEKVVHRKVSPASDSESVSTVSTNRSPTPDARQNHARERSRRSVRSNSSSRSPDRHRGISHDRRRASPARPTARRTSDRSRSPYRSDRRQDDKIEPRKRLERSLSPYSKRQAMRRD